MTGWIKLHRKITSHWVFNDPDALKLFIYLITHANHKDAKTLFNGQLLEVKRGQMVVGRNVLSKRLSLSVRTLRTLLNKLEIDQLITLEATNKFTLLTVANYGLYQDSDQQTDQQTTSKPTNKRPANDQQTTTSKECKEGEEGKEERKTAAKRGAQSFDFSKWPSEPSTQVLADWVKVRKTKRAELTQTAIDRLAGELEAASKHGLSVDDCLGACCDYGWTGFKLDWWLARNTSSKVVSFSKASPEDIAYEQAMREAGF